MVFQQYSLYPHLTVRENLAFPLKSPLLATPPDAIRAKVGAVAEMLRISHNWTTRRRSCRAARCSASRSAARWCAAPAPYLMDEPLTRSMPSCARTCGSS